MKPIDHIIRILFSAIPAVISLPSCSGDGNGMDSPDPLTGTIKINTVAVGGSRTVSNEVSDFDDTFMILLWNSDAAFLEIDATDETQYDIPYHRSISPQPVMFYTRSTYDTRYPYLPNNKILYATGYAPGNMLEPKLPKDNNTHNYKILKSKVPENQRGRYDFLSCDFWKEVYRGAQDDPFSQDKNKLYFRHLAAKLTFYADRDKETMENKQYVRNVQITKLQMKIGDGEWETMYTPNEFSWERLTYPGDFTKAYLAAINAAKNIKGNEDAQSTYPTFGYKTKSAIGFAGADDSKFVLKKPTVDRVPITGMDIDSCYVCNPIGTDGKVRTGKIQLRMDISADMSYHPGFPRPEGDDHDTNDLTFTRKWEGVTVSEIKELDEAGNATANNVIEFKPGHEYRIYIHFFRSGIHLVAKEMPWNEGGLHYVTIPGSDPNPDTNTTTS